MMQPNLQVQVSGYVRWLILGVLAILIISLVSLAIYWQPEKTMARQHNALLGSVEENRGARMRRLISSDYQDRWGFNAADATETMLDVRSQFLVLSLTREQQTIEIDQQVATVKVLLSPVGTPIGAGTLVMSRARKVQSPFTFTWKKESFLPGSWRLVAIENESIPDRVWGYKPGSIRKALR